MSVKGATTTFEDDALESAIRMGEGVASVVESEIVSEHNSEEGRFIS